MKVLLIGGTGFIGHNVLEQLAGAGHRVAVFHRGVTAATLPSGVLEIKGDRSRLADHRHEFSDFSPDVAVDFALSSASQAEATMQALSGIAPRVMAISSMDVYRACGISHRSEEGELQPLPLTEDSELRSKRLYSPESLDMMKSLFKWVNDDYDKIPVEKTILSNSDAAGTVLRLPMVYGPGDPLHRMAPLVKRMLDGRRKIILPQPRAQWRGPKGYVEDVAQAIVLAALSNAACGRIYNIAEAHALTELEWAQLVAAEMNWDGEFVILPAERVPRHLSDPANFAQHWVVSSARIRQELAFDETISRKDAIHRTVAWERDHLPLQVPLKSVDYDAEDAALEDYAGSATSS